jgi:hypothetical protein
MVRVAAMEKSLAEAEFASSASRAAISSALARNSAVGSTPQPNVVARGALWGCAMTAGRTAAMARAKVVKRTMMRSEAGISILLLNKEDDLACLPIKVVKARVYILEPSAPLRPQRLHRGLWSPDLIWSYMAQGTTHFDEPA